MESKKISIYDILSFVRKVYRKTISIFFKYSKVAMIIGLMIGFIIGYIFCSYTIIPNIISGFEQRIHKLENRITNLQNKSSAQELLINDLHSEMLEKDRSIAELRSQINEVNQQLTALYSEIVDNEHKITALSDIIMGLETKIETLENQIRLINLTGYDSTVFPLVQRLEAIEASLCELRTYLYGNEAYYLLRKTLANPGTHIAEQITNSLFSELKKSSDNNFQQWIVKAEEIVVKNAIASIIDSKMPSLVWNKNKVVYLGNDTYSVSVITYFPMEINTGIPIIGTITISRIALVMNGTINIKSGIIIDVHVESLKVL